MQDDPRVPSRAQLETLSAELEAQPALLTSVARGLVTPDPALARLVEGRGRIAFVGLGSSRDACVAAAWFLRSRGVDATVHMPSEPLGGLTPDALVVVVSASGETPSVVEAIERLDARVATVAVTRDGAGSVAERADAALALGCDAEASGIAVWSFLASLVALGCLAEMVTEGASSGASVGAQLAAERLASLRLREAEAIAQVADLVRRATVVHLVAPLARLGAALQAAQVLREVPRLPAVALAAEDWDHAHAYLTIDPDYVAVVSGPTEADDELLRWVTGRGRSLVSLGGPAAPDGPGIRFDEPDPFVRVLLECPLVESVALRAWAAAAGRGRGTGGDRMRR